MALKRVTLKLNAKMRELPVGNSHTQLGPYTEFLALVPLQYLRILSFCARLDEELVHVTCGCGRFAPETAFVPANPASQSC